MSEHGCKWANDDDGIWWTECGNAHQFTDGGPRENHHYFCPYCGGHLCVPKTQMKSEEDGR